MKKKILLSSAVVPLLFALGCGDSKNSSDAANLVDTAISSDSKPADTAKPVDTAKPTDGAVAEAGDALVPDGGASDGQVVDAPITDAKVIDAPAVSDVGSDAAVDVSGCTPSLPIVKPSTINTATTWTAGKVYVLDQSIVLNAVLTIEPGVVVKFTKGPAISMGDNGGIVADGKSAAGAIVFTSIKDDAHGGDTNNDCNATAPAPGDWAAVKVTQDSIFNYVQFFYGGSQKPYTGVLSLNYAPAAQITNCTFAYNDGGTPEDLRAAALNVANGDPATKLTGNIFYGNSIPLVVHPGMNLDNSNVFRSQPASAEAGTAITNTYNGIFVAGAVDGAALWSNVTVPYVVYKQVLTVRDNASLTLADGVVVKTWQTRIDVLNLGTLTPATSAVFTSYNDDSRLGDTNADGAASSPIDGDWLGVNLCKPLCKYATWGNIFYAQKI
jgi:hypothetical protein